MMCKPEDATAELDPTLPLDTSAALDVDLDVDEEQTTVHAEWTPRNRAIIDHRDRAARLVHLSPAVYFTDRHVCIERTVERSRALPPRPDARGIPWGPLVRVALAAGVLGIAVALLIA